MKQAAHHLREVTACRSMKDHLEYWNLHVHISYVTSELYRSTLRRQKAESESTANLRETCVDSLADTVEAFLGLQNLTLFLFFVLNDQGIGLLLLIGNSYISSFDPCMLSQLTLVPQFQSPIGEFVLLSTRSPLLLWAWELQNLLSGFSSASHS
jgi:hypothetical protein